MVDTPVHEPNANNLYGVVALTATDVWAVGASAGFADAPEPLALHWDGGAWTAIAAPNGNEETNVLWGVTGSAAGEAWAVGVSVDTPGAARTLVEVGISGTWGLEPSPNVTGTTTA